MVRGPAHGPRVDVLKIAATPWAPVLVAFFMFEELLFAVPHSSRDCSVASSRDERQPSQYGENGHHVDLRLRLRLRLIQQLSPSLACLAPLRGDSPVKHAYNVRPESTRCTNLILKFKLIVTSQRSSKLYRESIMEQSHSLSTDLQCLSFWSVFMRMLKRSTTRPYQQLSKLASNSVRVPS